MKAFVVQFPFGLMAFDEEKRLIEKVIFPKRHQTAARIIAKLNEGKLTKELETLVNSLQTLGFDIFVFDSPQLSEETKTHLNIQSETLEPQEAEKLRSHVTHLAVELGFAKDEAELSLWTRNVTMELAKIQIRGETQKRDLIVGQAIQTLDDLDRTLNLFIGRLREWYGVHFPELDRLIEKHETYARLVLDLGAKNDFTEEALIKEDLPKNKAEQISRIAETSMGSDLVETDLAQIQGLSKNVLEMYKLRESMETYLEKTMDDVAPNTKTIVGALLGARLIAIAGGLENLAKRPASTIQVLGAEKALFRSIKTGARPPKHGLIFQHTLIHDAKRWQRGKIARAIAGKLAIAVRADAFGGEYVGDKLKADLYRRIEEIRKKYAEPPPTKEKKPQDFREKRYKEQGKGKGFRERRTGSAGQGRRNQREGTSRGGEHRRGGRDRDKHGGKKRR
jgi:nucleolar protein 56